MEIRKILKDKRGLGIGDLYPVILTIAIVAILLGIVMMVLEEWQGVTNTKSGTTSNEISTVLMSNVSSGTDTASNATFCGFDDFAITEVRNETGETAVAPANYTVISEKYGTWKLTIEGAGNTEVNDSYLNFSYTFSHGGKDCEAVEDIVEDFVDFIPWIGIILLVIAAAIVLGVVISSFAGKKERV